MNRPTIIALIGLAVAAIAALLAFQSERDDAATPAVAVPSAPAVVAADSREPSFDVVRIGSDGDTVIAGRALPGAQVTILDGGQELGQVTADTRGEWVFVPAGPLPAGHRELRLRALNPDGSTVESGEPVVLSVPESGKGPALAIKPLRGGGSKLLQGPAGDASGPLSLETIEHDDQGRLFMGGKAPAGGRVFLYLDNRFVGKAEADAEGAWRIQAQAPPTQPPGKADRHLLRVDLVGDKGKVLARVEAPWTPGEEVSKGFSGVMVAPGNSLWRIARRLYGHGAAYTVIYAANRDLIQDPDRIYPGQVFSLPPR